MTTNNTKFPGGDLLQQVEIRAFDSPSCDAFGRWRISSPTTLFDSKLLNADDSPLFWEEKQISGTNTAPTAPTAAKPYIDLASINTTAGVYVRQTYRRFNYRAGESQLIQMTGVLELASGVTTGCERRLGYYDDDNGLFFESDAGTIGVTVRSNDSGTPVDTTIIQADWNIDTLDGDDDEFNPSGFTSDWTKAQIFVIDFQWLSVGRVRFGIAINGMVSYVHEVNLTSNLQTIPYMSTPCLPLRYELITTADSGVCSMRVICSSVIIEGGTEDPGVVMRASTGGTGVTTAVENTVYAVLGIRLKTTHVGTTIKLLDAGVQIHTASEFIEWLLIWNPSVAGTFAYSGITNSSIEKAVGATANVVTGGTVIGGGYIESAGGFIGSGSGGGALDTALTLGVDIAGTVPDGIVLCIRAIGGAAAATVEGSLTWRELI